jgi:hypothetical protein
LRSARIIPPRSPQQAKSDTAQTNATNPHGAAAHDLPWRPLPIQPIQRQPVKSAGRALYARPHKHRRMKNLFSSADWQGNGDGHG